MSDQEENLAKIATLAHKHKVVIIGEMHGVRENVSIASELIYRLKKEFSLIVGFEYPQSLVDNPSDQETILLEDGRYSQFHEKMVIQLKKDGIDVFGFDLDKDQLEIQKSMPWDWRDKIMADNVNKKFKEAISDAKFLLIAGDVHYQTKVQEMAYPDEKGEVHTMRYLPMGAQLDVSSLLAVHLRYLSGYFYNYRLKQMPRISVDKPRSFRDVDDVVELDVSIAHPTKE